MPTFKILMAGAFALAQLAFGVAAQSTLPPAPPQKIAVNALTNKVYTVNYDADTVTAFDAANGTSVPIAVGDGPLYVAVNPATNRVYVNNSRAASLTVIDGATDTVIGTYPVGSTGPIAVNPVSNVIYVVRLTGTGTDEVTYFNGTNNTWYTIAVQSHQPIAVATNPVTNKLFVAAYSTGNVSMIDGTFNASNDHPTPTKQGVWSKPFALVANPVTNQVFVITEDSRGPIAVIDASTMATTFLLAGVARIPKAVAVNPVTNRAYALFSNELVAIDGDTLATTSIPVADAGTAVASLGVNTATNRILVASATGVLTVIDGNTNTVVTTGSVPAGTSGVAINPVTGTSYFFDTALHAVPRAVGESPMANPVVTTITPLPGNTTGPDFTLSFNASTAFSPSSIYIRRVYYQLDSTTGPWMAASNFGPHTATFTGVAPGQHTVHAFAVEGQDAPLATGAYSAPFVGMMASYTFTVSGPPKVDPSVSLASSSNPSTAGTSITFTASVSGANGTPTGTVTFRDGATALCSNVALASGAAACASATLSVGTHDITAQYSGDANYNPRVSGILQQQVSAAPTVPGAPMNVSATPGNAAATISFSPPSSNGGSPITSYSVSCSPGPVTASGTGPPITVAGLANGTTFACSVVAANAVGSGPASAPVNVTPQALVQTLTVAKSGAGSGTVSSSPAGIACGTTCAASFATGAAVTLSASAAAGSVFSGWSGACTGTGTCAVTMDSAKDVAAAFSALPAENPPRLGNISTRSQVLTGEGVMIAGFIIGGSTPKTLVVRARGPSMAQAGVAGVLANPQMQLFSGSSQIGFNDDWRDAANASALQATGFAPSEALESAILVTLDPGAYTAIVTGVGGTAGVAIVEVLEVGDFNVPLLNIATRGRVDGGDAVMIAGIIIQGDGPQTVVIRARGPSLSQAGVPNVLANPQLQLFQGQAAIASNDDWGAAANAADIMASGFAPSGASESAILVTLQPGPYTAVVSGAGGTGGIAIVEVFRAN